MNVLHIIKDVLNDYIINVAPGSKSITNRILFILSQSNDYSIKIINPLVSEDTLTMMDYCRLKGIKVYNNKNILLIIGGEGRDYNLKLLNLNNAGTVVRPLITFYLLKTLDRSIIIDGDLRMRKRPLKQLIKAISQLKEIKEIVSYLGIKYYLPIKILNNNISLNRLNYLTIENSISSQYISSLLLCIPLIVKRDISIIINNISSISYIYMTIEVMKLFNIDIDVFNNVITYIYNNNNYYIPNKLPIEGDYSAISYILSYMLINNNNYIIINNIDALSIQGDLKAINIIKVYNNNVYFTRKCLFLKYNIRRCIFMICIDSINIPDFTMVLIKLITLNKTKIIKLYNIRTWQFKESNRSKALSRELKKCKYKLFYGKNWMIIFKQIRRVIDNIVIDHYYDHRVVMCMASLKRINNININKPNVCKKTYPNYFNEV